MSKAIGLLLAAVLGGAIACSDITIPSDDFELPEPDTSLDPARLVIGEYIATPCALQKFGGGLTHLQDREEWALVDVIFGLASESDPLDGPKQDDLDLVRTHEGTILHVFNVPAVRVRILLSDIPELVKDGYWISVRDVPDATRYDLKVGIGFRRPLQDADVQRIEELGGRVTHRFDFINGLAALLPDRSIPELRSDPDVEYVEVDNVYCLA